MTKSKQVKQAVQSALPVSIRDAGTRAARAGDSLETVARWCAANIPNFPDDVSKEDRAMFKDGAFIHYQTVKAAQYYRREGKNLIRLDAKPDKFTPDHLTLDVAFATGITGQQLGGLKTTDPALYAEVTDYRDDCNAYASNRWSAVTGCWRRLTAVKRERSATDPWRDRMNAKFDEMGKSAKIAASPARGDVTAPQPDQYKAAVKAFWAALAS